VVVIVDVPRPLRIEHLDMPLTPERIWQAIQARERRLLVDPAAMESRRAVPEIWEWAEYF